MYFSLLSYIMFVADLLFFYLYKDIIIKAINENIYVLLCGILLILLEVWILHFYGEKLVLRALRKSSKNNTCSSLKKDITLQSIGIFWALIGLGVGAVYWWWLACILLILWFVYSLYPNPYILFILCFKGYHVYETNIDDVWVFAKKKYRGEKIEDLIKINGCCYLER